MVLAHGGLQGVGVRAVDRELQPMVRVQLLRVVDGNAGDLQAADDDGQRARSERQALHVRAGLVVQVVHDLRVAAGASLRDGHHLHALRPRVGVAHRQLRRGGRLRNSFHDLELEIVLPQLGPHPQIGRHAGDPAPLPLLALVVARPHNLPDVEGRGRLRRRPRRRRSHGGPPAPGDGGPRRRRGARGHDRWRHRGARRLHCRLVLRWEPSQVLGLDPLDAAAGQLHDIPMAGCVVALHDNGDAVQRVVLGRLQPNQLGRVASMPRQGRDLWGRADEARGHGCAGPAVEARGRLVRAVGANRLVGADWLGDAALKRPL
mmetsp:Transcript_64360/g.173857  ORF Transcript_64360/g.173857 Transcript_64360/m.173857 type:complete len:318 (+) Transcript_64360:667-1620(+)